VNDSPVTLLAYTAWLAVALGGYGIGPATVLLRAGRLPASLWLPLTFLLASAASYGVWCAYVVDPTFGRAISLGMWLVSVASFGWTIARSPDAPAIRETLRRRDAWLPATLTIALTFAYLCLLSARTASPNDRFTWSLPPDNDIPRLLAVRMEQPVASRPDGFLLGDWRSSDRPPLQAGIVLALRPFDYSSYVALTYQAVGTICQMGWVLAVLALARTIRLSRRQTAYVLMGCAASGFFLLHSIYVWPKLLSAWLLLLAVTLMFRVDRDDVDPRIAWPLIAGSLALSMLAHGGALFALLALAVLAARLRLWRRADSRSLAYSIVVGAVFMTPWLLYQRMIDPPGNRLTKMHLAGVEQIDSRGLLEAVTQEYGKLTVAEYWHGRLRNLATQVLVDARAPDETWADWTRRQEFLHHGAALDFLVIGLLGLFVRTRRRMLEAGMASLRDLRSLALSGVASLVFWALVMFTPGSAVIHQGSFAVTALLFFCGAAALVRWPPLVQFGALSGHILLFAWAWLATRQVSMMPTDLPWRPVYVALSAAWAATFLVLLLWLPVDDEPGSQRRQDAAGRERRDASRIRSSASAG
jgi:hypothetical protein